MKTHSVEKQDAQIIRLVEAILCESEALKVSLDREDLFCSVWLLSRQYELTQISDYFVQGVIFARRYEGTLKKVNLNVMSFISDYPFLTNYEVEIYRCISNTLKELSSKRDTYQCGLKLKHKRGETKREILYEYLNKPRVRYEYTSV